MSLILNIDTCTESAGVTLAENGDIIYSITNTIQAEHAAFLHPAIRSLFQTSGKKTGELDAIAVSHGPGSYTGIRVGMATAKGLCIALDKPLLTVNSLVLLAKDAITSFPGAHKSLFCPMIDARRMEVYTALYDRSLNEMLKPCAMVLNENSYYEFVEKYSLIYFGSGSNKWKSVVKLRNSIFTENRNIPVAMSELTQEYFNSKSFTDVVYSEPLYLKEFYNGA